MGGGELRNPLNLDRRPVPPAPPFGIFPYDLRPAATLLGARIRCMDASCDVRELTLGHGAGAPRVLRYDYGACRAGCCKALVQVRLRVPCEALPHSCPSCDCGAGHDAILSADAVRELKALLP
jgi:hypothetical protein